MKLTSSHWPSVLVLASSACIPAWESSEVMPAIMRPMDWELILGMMTPTSPVLPVRSCRACCEGTYPVSLMMRRMRSRFSSDT